MQYWLMKSEPDEMSIDDALAAPNQTIPWFGVRNYQARNFMRDQMQLGDGILFYHSSCFEPGIYGLAEVASTPYPDHTQFDSASPYFDAKAKREEPRWMMVDVKALRKTRVASLPQMRLHEALSEMVVLQKGSRLSITPVTAGEWNYLLSNLL
jgi:predicted RNA-binding protein with PUA-like domain